MAYHACPDMDVNRTFCRWNYDTSSASFIPVDVFVWYFSINVTNKERSMTATSKFTLFPKDHGKYIAIHVYLLHLTREVTLKLTWTVIYNCKRQPYFFSIEPLSKTRYWLGVCHGWFHLQGLTGGVKNASWVRIIKLKSLVHCGIRTRDLPFTNRARYHWATETDVSRADKRSPGFTCAIFRNLPVARVRCSKIICRLFLSSDICIVLLFTN